MNKRERARVVEDLREAAELAHIWGLRANEAVDDMLIPFDRWDAAWLAANGALDELYYTGDKRYAPLALLFVAAAVEAGDWP